MRRQGWERDLHEIIEGARGRPFSWGTHDCATWVADVRRALTGIDAAASWRGTYKTERGALREIRRRGFARMSDWVTSEVGAPLAAILLAQRGDIVLDEGTGALGICTGSDAAFVSPQGLMFLPLAGCSMAWRV